MPGVIEPSSGYLIVTAAHTTAIYPTDLIGGSTTTAASSIFSSASELVIDRVVTDVVATTAGTITIADHAGVTKLVIKPQTLDVGGTVAGSAYVPGNGIPTRGLRAISATAVAVELKIFFTIRKQ